MRVEYHEECGNRYAIIDDFLSESEYNYISNNIDELYASSISKTWGDLSEGKSTVSKVHKDAIECSNIITKRMCSEEVRAVVQSLIGAKLKIDTLLDFDDPSGHSNFHRMAPESFLGLHVDRSTLPGYPVTKVANALLYLSKQWAESYGGDLYLRNGILRREGEHIIRYRPNRMVVLLHTSTTFHGVTKLSTHAPVRDSAYMDYYVRSNELGLTKFNNRFWRHETVYLPEFGRLYRFFRRRHYIFDFLNYLRKQRFTE